MLGKTHYKLGDYDEAIMNAERLLREFPRSAYVDDGHYLLGNCHNAQGEYAQAAEEYVSIIESGSDPRLVERARSRLEALIVEELRSGEIEHLYRRYPDNLLLAETATPTLSQFKIGVLAPLTGEFEDAGQEMVQGVRLAVRYSDFRNVDLVIEDSRGEPIQTVKATQKLANQESVQAIIGPVRSETTVGAAGVVTNRGLLCHPHASKHELDLLKKRFEVNADIGTANYGVPLVGACMIANAKGAIVGTATTPIELGRIEEALEL